MIEERVAEIRVWRRMMEIRGRGLASAMVILLMFHCLLSSSVGQVFESDSSDDSDCLYEGRDACNRADLLGCVWCELPRRCYSAARSLELGAFCNRASGKESVEAPTCGDVRGEAKCSTRDECRWCRSQELDDGCFSSHEALRLPTQIFDCPDRSPHLPSRRRK